MDAQTRADDHFQTEHDLAMSAAASDSANRDTPFTKGRRVVYVPDYASGPEHGHAEPGVVADQDDADAFRPDADQVLVVFDTVDKRMETGDEPFTAQRTPVRNLHPVAGLHEDTGNVTCAHCGAIHMTPAGMTVGPGFLRCQVCAEKSAVTHHLANRSNADAFLKANASDE